jgi:hypothetical protein
VEKGSFARPFPLNEIESISQNIGLPMSGINYAYSDSQTVSEADGEIIVTLKEERASTTLSTINELVRKDDATAVS